VIDVRMALLACGIAASLLATWAPAPKTGSDGPERPDRYRPLYHFTPPQDFMNDPNGLVFFRGEYHLFYQHNPEGPRWGHMSWGHAVSPDLVHWRHLPVAIHESGGTMIFSGSAVVDGGNTTGFGRDGEPPLVAIYTGHGHGRQTQNLAYSLDRGRTWTKYAGNPVLDIGSAEFRDPMVFRHGPTGRWVMVVVLAAEKKVRFYGSADLKSWERLSDFGPAGATGGVWECPNLFPLPVEGRPGTTRWVLKVDVNPGSVSGGSGGQYFVGTFDGKAFTNESGDWPLWIDYGKDFYAAQSWSDMPESDGRRVWLGWMANWQYANRLPTRPWRGAMTVPRTLTLCETPAGLRLAQAPVRELKALRGRHTRLADRVVSGKGGAPADEKISGAALEVVAEFEPGTASEFGLKVRRGEDEETLVGYDVRARALFVDRTRSGESDFNEEFSGRHAGPLAPEGGRVKMHLFVDTSSVEVFGNHGRTVITDLIFPDPASRGLGFYAKGGTAKLVALGAWELETTRPHPEGGQGLR
jgi:fructan beta-fructosidase